MSAILLVAVVVWGPIIAFVVLRELAWYRWWFGCYPWQKHEPRDLRSPIAVFDENGDTKYIMDDE